MKIEDIFEDMRPVATVWRKRGEKIERGRMSKFSVNLQPLTKIGVRDGTEEKKRDSIRPDNGQKLPTKD